MALFLKQAHVRVEPADHILHAAALLPEVAHEEPFFLEHDLKLFELAFLLAQTILCELERGRGLLGAMLALPPGFLQATELVHGKYPRELVRSLGKVAMFAGAVHLALKRAQLARDLAADVAGTGEVLVHALDLARGALLAALVLGDARGLLDERAALLRAALKDGVELALADDGMGILAQARIVQDVLDIHESARALVDEVLALTRTVHAPRDGNLVEIDGEHVVGIVEHERDLGHAHGLARRGTREDDILHGLAAQLLRALLAQNPEDGIGDIRFTRSVGTDNDREAGLEDHVRAVGKRLKALQGERLQVHGAPLSVPRRDDTAVRGVAHALERIERCGCLGLLLRGAGPLALASAVHEHHCGEDGLMSRSTGTDELVGRRLMMVALHAFLEVGLRIARTLGAIGGEMRLEGAGDEVLGRGAPTIEKEGAHERLVHVLERGVQAARARSRLGSAEDDALVDPELLPYLREHLARNERNLEAREPALVKLRVGLVERERNDGTQDGIAQELQALV